MEQNKNREGISVIIRSDRLPSSKLIIILEDKEYMGILRDRLTEIRACLVEV